MITESHWNVLQEIYQRIGHSQIAWAITGSLGFALHGMDTEVHDVDLQSDRDGAFSIEQAFSSQVVRPVHFSETETVRSYFGELRVLGLKIEVMGALQKRLPSGAWESPVDVRQHRGFILYDGMNLPVLSLRYEETAYRKLGRTQRADQIRDWLRANTDARPSEE